MKLVFVLHSLALGVSASTSLLSNPQSIFTASHSSGWKIPTVRESAVQARRMLRLENIGTLSTVFPTESSASQDEEAQDRRPHEIGGAPIGLMEYFADCESHGNPTILAVDIATSIRNAKAGSNITLSLRWHPQDGKWRTPANLPRFSLMGHLEDVTDDKISKAMRSCYSKTHPDAMAWLPGNDIHESHWARLVVDHVYWFGGFGDRAYIGWIPMDVWTGITETEIDAIRLPGELADKGWFDWL